MRGSSGSRHLISLDSALLTASDSSAEVVRLSESVEQQKARLEAKRVLTAQAQLSETVEQLEVRLKKTRLHNTQAPSSEIVEQQEARLETARICTS